MRERKAGVAKVSLPDWFDYKVRTCIPTSASRRLCSYFNDLEFDTRETRIVCKQFVVPVSSGRFLHKFGEIGIFH